MKNQMINTEKLKAILSRKVKLNDGERTININIGETAREMDCKFNDVLNGLKRLEYSKEIKCLTALTKEEYVLTVMEKSSILKY
ncbi:MAG: hypothetical protein K5920_12080 [Bacteroidales bacterium]|nr:hypothetical protein [Bacteroidales bacterium]